MNNFLDLSKEANQIFIASVLAVLCEQSPITIDLKDIEKYWNGEIRKLQYDVVSNGNLGVITFSLKEKTDADYQSQNAQDN